MKLVQAILAPERLEAVQAALGAAEVFRLTVSDVQGVGGRGGPLDSEAFSLRPLVRLEVAVNEEFLKPTLAAIVQGGGDAGKIFVLPLHDVIRIRTGERGPEAI
jgi:nitrogen regulatory protein P-II 1